MTRAATKKPTLRLTIEKAIYGGAGLGHAPAEEAPRAGKAVFVPMTLPGEVVDVEILNEKKQFASARLLSVVSGSADRVEAECEHYGVCGGCDYQHANYAAQLGMKSAILRETLERAGLKKLQAELPEIEVHSGEAWGYRNRVRLHVALLEGRVRLGYTRAQSNVVVPIRECPIAPPLLVKTALALEAMAYEDLAALDLLTAAGEVELFCDADESAVMATLWPRDEVAGVAKLDGLPEELQARVPQVQAMSWRGGNAEMEYSVGAETYLVPQDAFFQANRHLLPELLSYVSAGRRGKVAWDLYAGVGLFARVLAREFEVVEAVESSAAAAAGLKKNIGEGCRVHENETLRFLMQRAKAGGAAPDLIVADPPRAGLGADVCRLIATMGAAEMVYVSCDPATLARDLAALMAAGHRCEELHLFDMFPQTSHIESVAVLRK